MIFYLYMKVKVFKNLINNRDYTLIDSENYNINFSNINELKSKITDSNKPIAIYSKNSDNLTVKNFIIKAKMNNFILTYEDFLFITSETDYYIRDFLVKNSNGKKVRILTNPQLKERQLITDFYVFLDIIDKKNIINQIEELINNGYLNYAKTIVMNRIKITKIADAQLYSLISVILSIQNNPKSAIYYAKKAYKIDNNNHEIIYNYAYLLKILNNELEYKKVTNRYKIITKKEISFVLH